MSLRLFAALCLALLVGACAQTTPAASQPAPSPAEDKAGAAPGSLDEKIAADPERFVGLSADPDGTLVIALTAGIDERQALSGLVDGRKYRTVSCATTRSELEKVVSKVKATDLRATSGYGIAVDPATCSVRLEGDFPEDVVAQLTARFGRTLVIKTGTADRA